MSVVAPGGHVRRVRGVIVLGGSSIQGSGTFDTGAEDALCSGPTRPARPVSPEDAGDRETQALLAGWQCSSRLR